MTKFEKELTIILKACDTKKAYEFALIDISKLTTVTDFFIVCSGNNEKQTVAIADEIIREMSKENILVHHKEGYETGRWILLDYGFAIVHIFHKDERAFYNLESLWEDGVNIDVEKYGVQNWK